MCIAVWGFSLNKKYIQQDNSEYMNNIKFSLLVTLLILIATLLKAQDETKNYYLTTNVFAPVSSINKNSTALNVLIPLFSNLEYGFTLSGGYFKKHHALETRLTYGKSNDYNQIPQIQFGYNFFVLDYFKHKYSG